jgi:hypothetical protein
MYVCVMCGIYFGVQNEIMGHEKFFDQNVGPPLVERILPSFFVYLPILVQFFLVLAYI